MLTRTSKKCRKEKNESSLKRYVSYIPYGNPALARRLISLISLYKNLILCVYQESLCQCKWFRCDLNRADPNAEASNLQSLPSQSTEKLIFD